MAATSENDKLDQLAAELEGEDSPDNGGAVDQNDIDALLAEFQNAAAAEPSPEPAAAPVPEAAPQSGGPLGQDEIDRLLNGGGTSSDADAGDAGDAGGGPMGQDEIDRLLGGGAAAETEDDPGDGPMGQDEIDRLMKGGADPGEAADEPVEDTPTPEEDSLSDQEKMDRLIAELQQESLGGGKATEAVDTAAVDIDDEGSPADADAAPGLAEPAAAPGAAPVVDAPAPDGDSESRDAAADVPSPAAPESAPSESFDALDDDEIDLDGYDDPEPAPMADTPARPAEEPPPGDAFVFDGRAAAENTFSPAPEPVATDDDVPMPPPSDDDVEARLAQRQSHRRAVALEERKPARRWPRWVMAAGILVAAAVGGAVGYRYVMMPDPPGRAGGDGAPVTTADAGSAAPDAMADSAPLTSGALPPSPVDSSSPPALGGLEERFARIDDARQAMMDKQNDILQLRREYEAGIRETEAQVVQEARDRGITRFKDAAGVEAITYGLRTIARRLDYIEKLEAPIKRLHDSSEALLYAKRLASVETMLVGLAEGTDSTRIGRLMDDALATHTMADDLALPPTEAASEATLEELWQRISDRMKGRGGVAAVASETTAAADAEGSTTDKRIWADLCKGNFSDKYQLTALSTEAAGCLAAWQGAELFLNRIDRLSPLAAKGLSGWKGQWLAMNRLESLSVAGAQALFKWPGTRLSLNGLRQIPDEAAVSVANWPGKELELMGLERLSLPMAKALAHWKRNGGRLFVPDKFYRKK